MTRSLRKRTSLESAKDEKNEYTDWFIWTDSNFSKYMDKSIHGLHPRDGGYLINYYACQPALNYGWNKLPEKGVRGFRIDLANSLVKDCVYNSDNDERVFLVAINPGAKAASITASGKVLLSQNCKVDGDRIELTGKSFIIIEK